MNQILGLINNSLEQDVVGIIFLILLFVIVAFNIGIPILFTRTANKKIIVPDYNLLKSLKEEKKSQFVWYAGLAGTKINGEMLYYDIEHEVDPRGPEVDFFPDFSPNYAFILITADNSGRQIVVSGEILQVHKIDGSMKRQHVIFTGSIICGDEPAFRSRTVDGDFCLNKIS